MRCVIINPASQIAALHYHADLMVIDVREVYNTLLHFRTVAMDEVVCDMIITMMAQAAGMAAAGAGLAVAEAVSDMDGRSQRSACLRKFSIRVSQFTIALENPVFNDGWFVDQFRCTRSSFDYILDIINKNWLYSNDPIGLQATFLIRERVAVALHYLAHSGNIAQSGKMFGMAKASAHRYLWQLIRVLENSIKPIFVTLPTTTVEWQQLCNGFEAICGFPRTCLAIDGSLFEIERPVDYEGWYCRKLFPALNVQLVVDYKGVVRSFDFRPGSANDKAVFNYSDFGKNIDKIVPKGMHIVADAGYKLTRRVMIPYPITDDMEPDESLYNYLHSRTRITVERVIGMIKNRFRILKMPLNQKNQGATGLPATTQMARIVQSCIILHNIFCHLQDPFTSNLDVDSTNIAEPAQRDDEGGSNFDAQGQNVRDAIKQYLFMNKQN